MSSLEHISLYSYYIRKSGICVNTKASGVRSLAGFGDVLSKIEYDDDNAELMKIMEKPLLKVGFVQIGEGYDFATNLQSLDHNAMERDIEAVFTGRYFGYNYE